MKDNKLIAEFMEVDGFLSLSQMEYHTSWDWLMPVIEKIGSHTLSSTIEMLAEYYYKDGDNQDGLEGIEEFYKAVVFWITHSWNKEKVTPKYNENDYEYQCTKGDGVTEVWSHKKTGDEVYVQTEIKRFWEEASAEY